MNSLCYKDVQEEEEKKKVGWSSEKGDADYRQVRIWQNGQ